MANRDAQVVADFGDEWKRHDQSGVDEGELRKVFDEYFAVFPWARLPENAVGFDLGCGSGRWAKFVAPRVGKLHCIDPAAAALQVARTKLADHPNCEFHVRAVDELPLADDSMDFGYSLGVLHHVPDTQAGLNDCVKKLRTGAPFLVYLYYAFDQRPWWFKAVWRVSDLLRRFISGLPATVKDFVTTAMAVLVYFPLARAAGLSERFGMDVASFPLSSYRDKSFYTMRTDARDRFGTRLEQRFTKEQIQQIMTTAGLERITFHNGTPYWCAVGYKRDAGRND